MWGVNYQTLMMMAADQPRYVSGEEATKKEKKKGKDKRQGKKNALAYFQTKLKE